MTASLPACESTDSRTAPLSTYMTLGAGSPCAKTVDAGSYSTRRSGTPVQSTSSPAAIAGGPVGLLVAAAARGAGFLRDVADRGVGPSSRQILMSGRWGQVTGRRPSPGSRGSVSAASPTSIVALIE